MLAVMSAKTYALPASVDDAGARALHWRVCYRVWSKKSRGLTLIMCAAPIAACSAANRAITLVKLLPGLPSVHGARLDS
jgi:hypothetical protein